jgi:capsular exopolysaccharide synthesis family protein
MEEELEFSDYYQMVRKNLGLVVLIFIICVGAAIAYNAFSPTVYEAKASVYVSSVNVDPILYQQQMARYDIETETEIIERTIIPQAVAADPKIAYTDIIITPIQQTNIIEIKVMSTNRRIAQESANSIAELYYEYSLEQKKADSERIVTLLSTRLEDFKQEIDALETQILSYEAIENKTAEQQAQQSSLEQMQAVKIELYDYLLKRKEEESILSTEPSSNIRIIELSELPMFPVRPRIVLNLLIGIFLGLIAGVGAAFLKEYAKDNYRSLKDIEKDFGPIVMGTIPKAGKRVKNTYIVQYRRPESRFSESIRMLRTNLMFYLHDKKIKLISVVSPQEKDGKTTTAANLAVSLAQNKIKVLLVDANIREPMLKYVFKIKKGAKGLTDVILGNEALEKAISKTELDHLYFIPAGEPNSSPSELLSSNKMKEICAKLKKMDYEAVIFDNSSLEVSETRFMAANTEGVLMVLRANKTRRENAQKAKGALDKVKANIIGVVYNFFD